MTPHLCSFCGKGRKQWGTLVTGPSVGICDMCVTLCNEIIAENARRAMGLQHCAALKEDAMRQPQTEKA